MATIDRQSLLAMRPTRVEPVTLPDGSKVHVREISAGERNDWLAAVKKKDDMSVEAAFVCLAACNPDGSRLFKDGDADLLKDVPSGVVARIADRARRLNGIGDEADAAAKKD
jgi:hypothetical protein